MKNTFFILMAVIMSSVNAQQIKQESIISVSGEGKVTVVPDYVNIVIAVETKGNTAVDVKKQNDEKVDAVIKYIKKMNIAKEDYQTQRVSLNPQYDYEKKKNYFNATQSIKITLRDLNKYDQMMEGLVNAGVNQINSIEFKSTQMKKHESEARKLAMQDARTKADDFLSVTDQKIVKIFSISDNSQPVYYPRAMYSAVAMEKSMDSFSGNETLAVGEINITANVNVSYILN